MRVCVTRAAEQADGLCARLESVGATPVLCPTIRIAAPESYAPLDRAVSALESYHWVVFASVNGVHHTLGRMEEIGVPLSRLARVSVAAVGPLTRDALEERGADASFMPEEHHAERLGRSLEPVRDRRVLIPGADIANPALAEILRARGATVDEVEAYRTVSQAPPADALAELEGGVDVVTFTSPSTVQGFVQIGAGWRDLTRGVIIATIGPLTSEAAVAAGLEVHVEAAEHTTEGLVNALITERQDTR